MDPAIPGKDAPSAKTLKSGISSRGRASRAFPPHFYVKVLRFFYKYITSPPGEGYPGAAAPGPPPNTVPSPSGRLNSTLASQGG